MSETDSHQTPTDTLILAMEQAESMESVMVVYRLRDKEGNSGIGWTTNIDEVGPKVALLEEVKFGIWMDACGIGINDEGDE